MGVGGGHKQRAVTSSKPQKGRLLKRTKLLVGEKEETETGTVEKR